MKRLVDVRGARRFFGFADVTIAGHPDLTTLARHNIRRMRRPVEIIDQPRGPRDDQWCIKLGRKCARQSLGTDIPDCMREPVFLGQPKITKAVRNTGACMLAQKANASRTVLIDDFIGKPVLLRQDMFHV